jgi:O-antigen/teichoic acid export membrane protein
MNLTVTRVVQTAASNGLRLTLAALTTVLIARTLQPEGRGVYAMIVTTATIALTVGHLSIGKSQIALWPDAGQHRFLTGNGLILGLILGTISCLLTLGIVAAFFPHLALWPLCVALLAVPCGVASVNLSGIAVLRFQTGLANRAVVLSALMLCLPILALTVTGRLTLTAAVICWAVSIAVPFVLFLRSLGLGAMWWKAALARHQLSLSGRYHIGLVAQHLLLTADVYLLNAFVSPTEVGLYVVAGSFLALAWVPTDAVSQVALHRQAVRDEDGARAVTARAIRFNLLLSSGVTAMLAIASPTLLPLLYGTAYAGSLTPLLLLIPGAIALSLVRPTQHFLVRLGRPLTLTAIPLGALAANLALNAVLIPRWHAAGAAVTSSLTYMALAGAEILWFARATGTGLRDLLPQGSDLRSVVALLPRADRRISEPVNRP